MFLKVLENSLALIQTLEGFTESKLSFNLNQPKKTENVAVGEDRGLYSFVN